MGNSMGGLTTVQKALSMLLVIIVVYGCYAVTTNDEVIKSINRVMSSMQSKPETEETTTTPDANPGAKPAAGAKPVVPSKK